MLQNFSYVHIADNTWASVWMVFRVLKGSGSRIAGIGDLVVITIKKSDPKSNVTKWSVHWALIIRTKKWIRREDGSYLRFADNAVVLVAKSDKWDLKPLWKRIFWLVPRELRNSPQHSDCYKSVVNMAQEVI